MCVQSTDHSSRLPVSASRLIPPHHSALWPLQVCSVSVLCLSLPLFHRHVHWCRILLCTRAWGHMVTSLGMSPYGDTTRRRMVTSGSVRGAAGAPLPFCGCVLCHCECVYTPHVLYPLIRQRKSSLFPCLPVVNGAAVNKGLRVSFRIRVLLKYMPRTGIAGSYGNSSFSFLRKICTIFLSLVPIYIPTYNIGGVPFL